jgi:thiol:disulfide interchange protein DsbD
MVGLHIRHHEDHHTYWRHPGIVGVPTQLAWTLPEGFLASSIRWPHPEKVDMAGHPAHGYRREVLLMVEITPPPGISESTVTLKAEATWMACARSCHPGHATFSLTLPVAEESRFDSRHRPIFGKTRAEIPEPIEEWEATVESPRDDAEVRILLTPRGKAAALPAGIYFFSSDGQVSSDPPQRIEKLADGSCRLILQRAEFGPENATSLPGVLAISQSSDQAAAAYASINPPYPEKSGSAAP